MLARKVEVSEEDFKLGGVRVLILARSLRDIGMRHISSASANERLILGEHIAYALHIERLSRRRDKSESLFIQLCGVGDTEIYKVASDAQLENAITYIGECSVSILIVYIFLHLLLSFAERCFYDAGDTVCHF